MGPLGKSTLCNACGVRYRASPTFNQPKHSYNRLVPEYRSRESPMFDQSEHSYKHREVLKIRKKQEHPAPPKTRRITNLHKTSLPRIIDNELLAWPVFSFLPVPDEVRPGSTSCRYLLLDDSPTWKLLFLLPPPPFQFLPLPPPPSFRFLTNCCMIHYNGSYCSNCMVCNNGLCGICWKAGLPRLGQVFDWPSFPKQHQVSDWLVILISGCQIGNWFTPTHGYQIANQFSPTHGCQIG
ncbi:hypothetical protein SORBI_3002G018250 [Sorghum bicolor]|uniref:GATA-type domain-containing protein n=1 Tax=Sorghum bicolor TaxID=4558 RepID=A0A1W0W1Y7_SORBI|nr:hypothetical protein SORBI_3002G018250 [Sorghum bicolor]